MYAKMSDRTPENKPACTKETLGRRQQKRVAPFPGRMPAPLLGVITGLNDLPKKKARGGNRGHRVDVYCAHKRCSYGAIKISSLRLCVSAAFFSRAARAKLYGESRG